MKFLITLVLGLFLGSSCEPDQKSHTDSGPKAETEAGPGPGAGAGAGIVGGPSSGLLAKKVIDAGDMPEYKPKAYEFTGEAFMAPKSVSLPSPLPIAPDEKNFRALFQANVADYKDPKYNSTTGAQPNDAFGRLFRVIKSSSEAEAFYSAAGYSVMIADEANAKLRAIYDLLSKSTDSKIKKQVLTKLLDGATDCAMAIAIAINKVFDELNVVDSLNNQIRHLLTDIKEFSLQQYVQKKHPSSTTALVQNDPAKPYLQESHIKNAYLILFGKELGLPGVELAHEDAFAIQALVQIVDHGSKYKNVGKKSILAGTSIVAIKQVKKDLISQVDQGAKIKHEFDIPKTKADILLEIKKSLDLETDIIPAVIADVNKENCTERSIQADKIATWAQAIEGGQEYDGVIYHKKVDFIDQFIWGYMSDDVKNLYLPDTGPKGDNDDLVWLRPQTVLWMLKTEGFVQKKNP